MEQNDIPQGIGMEEACDLVVKFVRRTFLEEGSV